MTRYIYLGIGTFFSLIFIFRLLRGSKYDQMVVNLDGGEFPLHNLYGVGLSWSAGKLFAFRGKKAADMKHQASMLYPARYAEYYAAVSWAGAITIGHLALCLSFLLAGLFYNIGGLLLAAGLFMGGYMAYFMVSNMPQKVVDRKNECEAELADVVSSLAILLNSGMVLREAWTLVGKSKEGALYDLINQSVDNLKQGMSEKEAFLEFARLSDSADIRKFTSAMIQSMEKGGSELTFFLTNQSSELWNYKRQKMLQAGEKAATKLLAPIMLIFFGILVIIITGAFAGAVF